MISGVLGEILMVTMARVGMAPDGRPGIGVDTRALTPPTPDEIRYVAQYEAALRCKAKGLRAWIKLARAMDKPAKATGRKRG